MPRLPRLLASVAALLIAPASALAAPPTNVEVFPNVRHEVGGVSELDRSVFFAAHTTPVSPDWNGEEDKLDYFAKKLRGHFGRDTGQISGTLNRAKQDPKRPGYADPKHIEALAKQDATSYRKMSKTRQRYLSGSDMIIGAQLHPFWPGDKATRHTNWKLSTTDTADEPFGTATGEFMGLYFRNFHKPKGHRPPPAWIEVVNEPLYELSSHGDVDPDQVFHFHNVVADQIRKYYPGVPVGGYTMAFDLFDHDDFGRWDKRFKSFIDITGDNMDFYSVHFYDFPGISRGKVRLRRGSNLEASFDLIDHYSTLKLGQPKPYLISEYGSQVHDWYHQPWSPYRDWLCVKAFNTMVMQFMERPDLVLKALAFTPPKAEWGRNSETVPYYWRLLRRANEGDGNTANDQEGPWVFSEQIKFWELWSDVRGTKVLIHSDQPDVQTQAYLSSRNLFVALNNLSDDDTQRVRLNLKHAAPPESVSLKLLYLKGETPQLDEESLDAIPDRVVLPPNATAILHIRLPERVEPEHTASESKTFADVYLQPIQGKKAITFNIDGVELGEQGTATLRLGIGRDHGNELTPTRIKVNGKSVRVPKQFRGDDTQADRKRFFGLLEVPVPYSVLQENNKVQLAFPETNGHVSSAALRVVTHSAPLE
ncbi:agarase [Algisphaera agarilytica]|uniref:Agarase n=1 Tax=Algisphaera agarilytica TaxID=1385975 RepID=A0A7X0LJQ6_9BACT|nr:agarase [Algisphaera agarilytica]MBB6429092.1 agarase [Algisphaera agarilytica]